MTTEVGSTKMLNNEKTTEINGGYSETPRVSDDTPGHGNIQLNSTEPTLKETESVVSENNNNNMSKQTLLAAATSATTDGNISSSLTKQSVSVPPPLQHVQINQVPLAMIIRNLTVFTIKELSQYLKTNLHQSTENNASTKKINFLQLIIFLRNQYLKLYVLIKWAKTIKNNNFNTMIDLLNWFRITNMSVNNCIWALKSNLTSMANAKLPNVDLVTALEVLSLGRPNLPTYNFQLSGESDSNMEIPSSLVLKRLRDLNLTVSIKISLMDIPEQFNNYRIKNGRIYISVNNEFEIQLSAIDRRSPLFFVDLNLLFNSIKDMSSNATIQDASNQDQNNNDDNKQMQSKGNDTNNDNNNEPSKLNPMINYNLTLNKRKLEKIVNDLLFKSKKPLYSLYQFLHKYVLTLQLYMIHIEISKLENGGKFSGGNLIHTYDSKKSIISGRYWVNGKMGNKGKFTIGVDRYTETLILRWDNEIAQNRKMMTVYHQLLQNIENILDEIMFNHSNLIRSELLTRAIFHEDDENPDVLLLQIPTTCISTAPVQLKIDLITGLFFFKNPSPLLMTYTKKINRSSGYDELNTILQQLKLDKISSIITNMFEKTGWICSKAVKLDKPIPTHLIDSEKDDNYVKSKYGSSISDELSLLQNDLFICLPNWPINWYLILTIISSNSSCIIEKRMGKIISKKGRWQLSYLDKSSSTSLKLENITYQKIMMLQKTILHRIINHMLIDSLNQLKIRNKVCSNDVRTQRLPKYLIHSDNLENIKSDSNSEDVSSSSDIEKYTSVILLELESFLEGSKALNDILESSMFMRIDYTASEIRLYARFKRNTMIKQVQCEELLIHFVSDDTSAFYLSEHFTNLSHIVTYLTIFRQKLMQLVVITDVVERLHKNFASDYFKITALKPKRISFNYLQRNSNSDDKQDCTINIITSNSKVKNLTVELAKTNPQHIIQPYINQNSMDYHFIFNYLQFTSLFFITLQKILNDPMIKKNMNLTKVYLGLHNLYEYQLVYHNPDLGTKITVIIELKSVCHNSTRKVQFYVHFSPEEHVSTKSPAYPQIHQVRNKIFMLNSKHAASTGTNTAVPSTTPLPASPDKNSCKYPHAVRLIEGISCDSVEIEPILMEIHNILIVDSSK